MQTIITAALAVGDVILIGATPTSASSGVSEAVQSGYYAAAKALAYANNVPYVDFSEDFGSYNIANNLGYMADFYHPRSLGYERQAQLLAKALIG